MVAPITLAAGALGFSYLDAKYSIAQDQAKGPPTDDGWR